MVILQERRQLTQWVHPMLGLCFRERRARRPCDTPIAEPGGFRYGNLAVGCCVIHLTLLTPHCGDGDEGVPYSTVMSLVLFTLFNDQIYLVKHLCDSNRTLGGRTLSWDDGTAATARGTRPAASYIRPNHSGATISRQCTPTDAPLLR